MQNKKRILPYWSAYVLSQALAASPPLAPLSLATTVILKCSPCSFLTLLSTSTSAIQPTYVPFCWSTMVFYILQTLVQYIGNLLFGAGFSSIVRDIRRDACNMEKPAVLFWQDASRFHRLLVWPMIRDHQWHVSEFYPALSQLFSSFLTTLYTMLVLDFRLDSFVLALSSLIFLLGQSLSEKSVKIIRNQKSSCSDINSKLAENDRDGNQIIQALIVREATCRFLVWIWWNQPMFHLVYVSHRSVALMPLRPAMSHAETPRLRRFDGYFWLPWSVYRDNGRTMYAFIQQSSTVPLIPDWGNATFSQLLQMSMVSAGRFFAFELDEKRPMSSSKDGKVKVKAYTSSSLASCGVLSYWWQTSDSGWYFLSVNKGETIAFVGHTGGNLPLSIVLMCFYEFQSGRVSDLWISWKLQSGGFENIGLASQDPFLLSRDYQAQYRHVSRL